MLGPEARKEAELHRLVRDREGARDHRLAGDDCRRRGDSDQWQPRPIRSHEVEGIHGSLGIPKHQRALADIVEHEARIDERKPRPADRLAPEMAHVRVKRLGAGNRQEHRTQSKKGELGIGEEELARPRRAQRRHDARTDHDIADAEHREHRHVNEDYRAEESADLRCPARLDEEQSDENANRNRDHQRLQRRLDDSQSLDR